MCPSPHRLLRAARSPIPAVLVVLALAAAAGLAEPTHGAGGYVTADRTEGGIPTGMLSSRALDLQLPDRSRDRGQGGIRRARGPGFRPAAGPPVAVVPLPRAAPQDAARSALARAGRLSSPATAPPLPS
jgi:hypothetical protein